MLKLQKILLGTFLGGVLLGGIGTGVAFVEYSSITYAGEKKIGQESMVTKNFDFSFDTQKGIVKVFPVWYDDRKMSYVETDQTVPEGVIRYRVTYNEKILIPFLSYHEYDEAEAETGFTDENEGLDASESSDGRVNVIEASDPRKKKIRCQGEIHLRNDYRDDFGLWMANKDEILSDLKQRRIASYQADRITEVKILVNPATEKFIKQIREY